MGLEIIHRQGDVFTLFELLEVFNHELCIERVGMVVVDLGALGRGELVVISVIGIVGDDRDALGPNAFEDDV